MSTSIVLFRNNLRIHDNEALTRGLESSICYPIYIVDSHTNKPIGEASEVWLNHSLHSLNYDLDGRLAIYKGDSTRILIDLVKTLRVTSIYIDHAFEPDQSDRDRILLQDLKALGCRTCITYQRLLWDIESLTRDDGAPFTVFSPFFRKGCLRQELPPSPIPSPPLEHLSQSPNGLNIDEALPLSTHHWVSSICKDWDISEKGALDQWQTFLDIGLDNYKKGRNFPYSPHVSRLSPYIHFGQISIRKLFHDAHNYGKGQDRDHFISELAWREFSYYLLYHFPQLATKNLQHKYDQFPWGYNEALYSAWCYGKTGYPIVDAGMRQLYQTGYMHNRLRMLCASFLVKNLMIHWNYGEQWFWNCLFDADHANNAAGWQWVAGSGADAASYFRIFNPIIQGYKFDPIGDYTKAFLPELRSIPDEYLYEPWKAPHTVLQEAGILLGDTYPYPIVEFESTRDQATAEFEKLRAL